MDATERTDDDRGDLHSELLRLQQHFWFGVGLTAVVLLGMQMRPWWICFCNWCVRCCVRRWTKTEHVQFDLDLSGMTVAAVSVRILLGFVKLRLLYVAPGSTQRIWLQAVAITPLLVAAADSMDKLETLLRTAVNKLQQEILDTSPTAIPRTRALLSILLSSTDVRKQLGDLFESSAADRREDAGG